MTKVANQGKPKIKSHASGKKLQMMHPMVVTQQHDSDRYPHPQLVQSVTEDDDEDYDAAPPPPIDNDRHASLVQHVQQQHKLLPPLPSKQQTLTDPPVSLQQQRRPVVPVDQEALAYLLRYETMVRQQEAEDMATLAHIRPCLDRLHQIIVAVTSTTSAASGQSAANTSSTGSATTSACLSLKEEISFQDLKRVVDYLDQQILEKEAAEQQAKMAAAASNASPAAVSPVSEFLTTDRQLMMVLRLLTQKVDTSDHHMKHEHVKIAMAELIQAYKICLVGMMALQHLPASSSPHVNLRNRVRDRTLAMLSLFEPPSTKLFDANSRAASGEDHGLVDSEALTATGSRSSSTAYYQARRALYSQGRSFRSKLRAYRVYAKHVWHQATRTRAQRKRLAALVVLTIAFVVVLLVSFLCWPQTAIVPPKPPIEVAMVPVLQTAIVLPKSDMPHQHDPGSQHATPNHVQLESGHHFADGQKLTQQQGDKREDSRPTYVAKQDRPRPTADQGIPPAAIVARPTTRNPSARIKTEPPTSSTAGFAMTHIAQTPITLETQKTFSAAVQASPAIAMPTAPKMEPANAIITEDGDAMRPISTDVALVSYPPTSTMVGTVAIAGGVVVAARPALVSLASHLVSGALHLVTSSTWLSTALLALGTFSLASNWLQQQLVAMGRNGGRRRQRGGSTMF